MPYFTFIGTPFLPYSVVITGVFLLAALIGAIDVLGKDSRRPLRSADTGTATA